MTGVTMQKKQRSKEIVKGSLALAGYFIFGITLLISAPAQSPSKPAGTDGQKTAVHGSPTHYQPNHFAKRATMYYQDVWGIDTLTVRAAESGELIRFNYRILDASKARQLNDKKAQPTLVDPKAGVQLVVPSLEKVGQLRQSSTPEEGRIYWMAFSNPRRTVTRGDRVNIVIGNFHAENLVVE
jgi:hypothetical protein